jgi:hypothetical protein
VHLQGNLGALLLSGDMAEAAIIEFKAALQTAEHHGLPLTGEHKQPAMMLCKCVVALAHLVLRQVVRRWPATLTRQWTISFGRLQFVVGVTACDSIWLPNKMLAMPTMALKISHCLMALKISHCLVVTGCLGWHVQCFRSSEKLDTPSGQA